MDKVNWLGTVSCCAGKRYRGYRESHPNNVLDVLDVLGPLFAKYDAAAIAVKLLRT